MKNSKLKFSEYMQNIIRSKSFGKFVLIVYQSKCKTAKLFSVHFDWSKIQKAGELENLRWPRLKIALIAKSALIYLLK